MAAIDDLGVAIANLKTIDDEIIAKLVSLNQAIASLNAQITALQAVDPAIASAAQAVQSEADKLGLALNP